MRAIRDRIFSEMTAGSPVRTKPDGVHKAQAAPRRGRGRPPIDGKTQRAKILDTATRMFIARGYSGTTLEAIGREARVSKRAIYQHVGTKAQLFRAVCKQRLPLADNQDLKPCLLHSDMRAVVTALGWKLLDMSFTPEAIGLERVLAAESLRFPKLTEEVIQHGIDTLNGNIAAIFGALVARGLLAPLDTARAADFFYDVIVGNRSFRMTLGHREVQPGEDEFAARIDMFIHGHLLAPSRKE